VSVPVRSGAVAVTLAAILIYLMKHISAHLAMGEGLEPPVGHIIKMIHLILGSI